MCNLSSNTATLESTESNVELEGKVQAPIQVPLNSRMNISSNNGVGSCHADPYAMHSQNSHSNLYSARCMSTYPAKFCQIMKPTVSRNPGHIQNQQLLEPYSRRPRSRSVIRMDSFYSNHSPDKNVVEFGAPCFSVNTEKIEVHDIQEFEDDSNNKASGHYGKAASGITLDVALDDSYYKKKACSVKSRVVNDSIGLSNRPPELANDLEALRATGSSFYKVDGRPANEFKSTYPTGYKKYWVDKCYSGKFGQTSNFSKKQFDNVVDDRLPSLKNQKHKFVPDLSFKRFNKPLNHNFKDTREYREVFRVGENFFNRNGFQGAGGVGKQSLRQSISKAAYTRITNKLQPKFLAEKEAAEILVFMKKSFGMNPAFY